MCATLASRTQTGRASPPLLFDLAPRGVFRAPNVAIRAVGSYPTFSPLPNALDRRRRAKGFALGLPPRSKLTGGLIFCGTFRSRAPNALSRWSIDRHLRAFDAQPPGVTRRAALRSHPLRALLRRSPDFPPAPPGHTVARTVVRSRRSPDSPAAISISRQPMPHQRVCRIGLHVM